MIKYCDLQLDFISESGDAISHYNASLRGQHTVKELVDYALSNKREWGSIEILDDNKRIDRIEYRYGEIVSGPEDKNLLNKFISLKRIDGGWTNNDYTCCIN